MSASAPEPRPVPDATRWRPLRAGLIGLWQYDDQELVFRRGRLLLRGRNESGKTKALELLLPFLLDGQLTPSRLDPFGGQSRSMRWNLLGEGATEGVRIGYAWLEFGRLDERGAPEYATLGAGLRARASSPDVDAWYFVTAQRVGEGLSLFEPERRPVARTELRERVGERGRVLESVGEYRALVNERLFGMPAAQYDALIDTLLKLRRPHLSEKLDPESLSGVLLEALPPLDEAVVGKLADGFEQLDRHRAEGQTAREALRALQGFLGLYGEYARATCKLRAASLGTARRERDRAQKALAAARDRLDTATASLGRLAEERVATERAVQELDGRVEALRASEAYRSAEAVAEGERQAEAAGRREREASERLARDRAALASAARLHQGAVDRAGRSARSLEEATRDVAERAAPALWGGPAAELARLATSGMIDGARGLMEALLAERRAALAKLEALGAALDRAQRAAAAAQREAREAQARVGESEAELQRVEAEAAAAEKAFWDEVEAWLARLRWLEIDGSARAALLDAPWPAAGERARGEVHRALGEVGERASETGARLLALRRELAAARAELDQVNAEREPEPPASLWRRVDRAREGGPLFLLCDPRNAADPRLPGLEAALEAAGLLDAWVVPTGELVDPRSGELLLAARPLEGRTLAEVLAPAADARIAPERLQAVLSSIRLVDAGAAPRGEEPAWIAEDGRFGLGPLRGRHEKREAAYLGAPARAAERARRVERCAARVAELEAEESRLAAAAEALRERRDGLREEERAFPSAERLRRTEADVASAGTALARERGSFERAAQAAQRAAAEADAAARARDATAVELGLGPWVNALHELRAHGEAFARSAERLLAAGEAHLAAREALAEREAEVKRAEGEAATSTTLHDAAAQDAVRLAERARALAEVLGNERASVLRKLHDAEEARRVAGARVSALRDGEAEAREERGRCAGQVEAEVATVAEREGALSSAADAFRPLLTLGVLQAGGIEVGGIPPDEDGVRVVIAAARSVEMQVPDEVTPAAREALEARVLNRQLELDRSLPGETRLRPDLRDNVMTYTAGWNGRVLALPELVPFIEEDIAARERLLDGEEAGLFESFLAGEAHEHLGARLRQADELVRRLRQELARCPTVSRVELNVDWRLDEEGAPPGAREAIDLFRREGHLLSSANKQALRAFLQARLRQARTATAAGTLRERMLAELDYRPWFRFEVRTRAPGEEWKRLTRKAHGAGSGGQKSVLLHLPLFAAAAAFYASARRTAPRLIVLDEAFAGIDRPMRAQLMGLLAAFDLDFMMTSHDEWGFYRELDGLSTYQLHRVPGMAGVHVEWFVWDGERAQTVES